MSSLMRNFLIFVSIVILAALVFLLNKYGLLFMPDNSVLDSEPIDEIDISLEEPETVSSTILENLSHPWDLDFLDDNNFIYTQRSGVISGYNIISKQSWVIEKIEDVYVVGEGGLLGLVVDVDFSNNPYVYTCQNVTGPSISVSRFELNDDFKSIRHRLDLITNLPSNSSGRHSGCRLAMDLNGDLWIGTGDTADGTLPQNPESLGGKVLRIDRDGNGVEGNLGEPFDPRIFSYGHRNIQGIVLFDEPVNDVYGYTSEHGPDRLDEINLLKKGNFGWDPIPGYNESVLMTDLSKFPDAISDIWNSGGSTIAVSGMTIIEGKQWEAWEGAVMMAALKGSHVRFLKFGEDYRVTRQELFFKDFGRIRTIVQGPNGNLYLLTDNGENDKIIEVLVKE